jgi:peptide/nickel transport system permease protein
VVSPLAKLGLQLVVALFLSTLAVRIAIELSIDGGITNVVLPPGTPLDSPAVQPIVAAYRLDQPLITQHLGWVGDALSGDFGRSFRNRGLPVDELINPRLPITFQLSISSLIVAILIGVPTGVAVTALRGRRSSRALELGVDVFRSLPVFILAPFLAYVFALRLGWLPIIGWERASTSITGSLRTMVLPMMSLALPEAAVIAQLVKAGLQDVAGEDFLVAARAKGLPRHRVFLHHALRPASLTTVTQLGLILGSLLGGAVVVEQIFAIGGMGVVLFDSIINRDLNVLLATTVYLTGLIVVIRGLSDIAYRALDPRIR